MRTQRIQGVPSAEGERPVDRTGEDGREDGDSLGTGLARAPSTVGEAGHDRGHEGSPGLGSPMEGLTNEVRRTPPPGLSARVDLINGNPATAQMVRRARAPGRSARRRREARRALEERAAMQVPDGIDP